MEPVGAYHAMLSTRFIYTRAIIETCMGPADMPIDRGPISGTTSSYSVHSSDGSKGSMIAAVPELLIFTPPSVLT